MSAAIDSLPAKLQPEYNRILHNACSMPGFNTTTTKPVAKALLLEDWIFCNGDARSFVVKNKGLGVYHISTQQKQ